MVVLHCDSLIFAPLAKPGGAIPALSLWNVTHHLKKYLIKSFTNHLSNSLPIPKQFIIILVNYFVCMLFTLFIHYLFIHFVILCYFILILKGIIGQYSAIHH